ncbi:hypothetical protein PUMCH_001778 [Australozyma saopauloensis]|uniref:Uncharacterized protein n=1 Tax=Australozyma saopauloensis TaxID=291208 RepID=A0AAX4H8C3_9ASCO|nr:hypothetical protein PUMCH_001778 [[Candida] saopauloensis]
MALRSFKDSIKDQDAQLVLEAYKRYPSETTSQNESKDQHNESTPAHKTRRSTEAEAPDSLAQSTNQSSLSSDTPLNLSQTVDGDEVFGDILILDSSPMSEKLLNQSQSEDLEIDARHTLIALPFQEILPKDGQSLNNVVPQGTESPIDTQLMSGNKLAAPKDKTASPKVTRVSRFWRKSPSLMSLQFNLSSAKDVLEKMLKAIVNFMKPKNEKLLDKIHLKEKSHIKHIVNVLLTIDGLNLIRALNTIDLIASFSYVRCLDSIHKSSGSGWKDLPMVQKFEKFINTEYTSLGIVKRVSRRDLMRILGSLGTREGYFLVCALSFEFKTPEQTALVEVFVEICAMVLKHASNQAIPAQDQQNASTSEKEVVAKVFGSQIGSSILNLLKDRYTHEDVMLLRVLLTNGDQKVKKNILAGFLGYHSFPTRKLICESDIPMTVQALVSEFGRGLIREICVPKNTKLEGLQPISLIAKFKSAESKCLHLYSFFEASSDKSQIDYRTIFRIPRTDLNRRKEKISDFNRTIMDMYLRRINHQFAKIGGSCFNSEDSAKVLDNVSETLRNISLEIDDGIELFHPRLSNCMYLLGKACGDHKIELLDRLHHAEIIALQCVNSFEYHIARLESRPPQIDSTCNSFEEILSSLNLFYSFMRVSLENYLREEQESARLMAGRNHVRRTKKNHERCLYRGGPQSRITLR